MKRRRRETVCMCVRGLGLVEVGRQDGTSYIVPGRRADWLLLERWCGKWHAV